MSRISKKAIKEIQRISVFDSILRDRFESTMTPYFADAGRPEEWQKEEREIFDIAADIEHRFKEEILKILGVAEKPQK